MKIDGKDMSWRLRDRSGEQCGSNRIQGQTPRAAIPKLGDVHQILLCGLSFVIQVDLRRPAHPDTEVMIASASSADTLNCATASMPSELDES